MSAVGVWIWASRRDGADGFQVWAHGYACSAWQRDLEKAKRFAENLARYKEPVRFLREDGSEKYPICYGGGWVGQ